MNVNVGENIRYRYIKNEVDIYEVICMIDLETSKYTELCFGKKYLLFLPKIGNSLIYIIEYDGVLVAKLDINDCIYFATPAVYRDLRINEILDD